MLRNAAAAALAGSPTTGPPVALATTGPPARVTDSQAGRQPDTVSQ